jgi:hypothetical protein
MPGGSRPERPLRASAPAITAPCQKCGRSPALVVTFRSVIGMLLPFRLEGATRRYCRECGMTAFRATNNRTLLLGWWSPFALVANLVVIVLNLRGYRRVHALGAPRDVTHVKPQTVRPVRHPEMR